MIPGEIITQPGEIELNAGKPTMRLSVANTGDRPSWMLDCVMPTV